MDWASVIAAQPRDVTVRSDPYESFLLGSQVKVLLAETLEGAEAAMQRIERAAKVPVFGLDMEWRPDRNPRLENKIALIQVSAGDHVALLHISQFGFQMPPTLYRRLHDPNTWFVCVAWAGSDQRKLYSTFHNISAIRCNIIDLQVLARQKGHERLGLESLSQELLHPSYVKPQQVRLSDWQRSDMDFDQIKYGALDALCAEHCYWVLAGEPWQPDTEADDYWDEQPVLNKPVY